MVEKIPHLIYNLMYPSLRQNKSHDQIVEAVVIGTTHCVCVMEEVAVLMNERVCTTYRHWDQMDCDR